MTRAFTLMFCLVGTGASAVQAADFSSYRGLHFGMNLAAAAKQAGTKASDARLVYQRPALIQEMDWQPSRSSDLVKSDPVKDGLLRFFNGELFRIVVTYDRYRVEGMTDEDMVEAISTTYGRATRPTAEVAYHSIYGETAPVIARWEDSEYSCNLIRTGDRSSFAIVLYVKRLDSQAQAAIVEAVKLDEQDAPRRELEKQQKRDEKDRLVLEKARILNKPNFRP